MNLPNKLTILRVILVPIFLAAFYLPQHLSGEISYNGLAALLFFSAASLTDLLDGHIARSQGLVTNFGKFLDPLADKVLVVSALCVFVDKGIFNAIPLIIIIAREFMVSGLRLVTAEDGVVVAASIWGKMKTAFTMCTIIYVLMEMAFTFHVPYLSAILIWASTLLTVLSGIDYLRGCWRYINTNE
jgi:CDP-diacylglycerol--glycerol-3-phosphate 3-phosphatidyltransferase